MEERTALLHEMDFTQEDRLVVERPYGMDEHMLAHKVWPEAEIESVREILQAKEEPVRWLVRGLVPVEGYSVLVGEPGVGKTWTAMSMTLHIANGLDFLGYRTEKHRVLYMAGEGGERRSRSRVSALVKAMIADGLHVDDNFYARYKPVKLDDKSGLEDLENYIMKLGIEVCVLDPFVRFLGGLSENDNGKVDLVLSRLDEISSRQSCDFIIVHHPSKSGLSRNDVSAYSGRGAGAIGGAANAVLTLARKDGRILLNSSKNRDGELLRPFGIELQVATEMVGDEEYLREARIRKLEEPVQAGLGNLQVIVDELQHAGGALKRRDIEAACAGMSKSTVGRLLRQGVEENVLARDKHGEYSLPEHEEE